VPVEIYVRTKDAEANAEQLKKVAEIIQASGVSAFGDLGIESLAILTKS
jgi:hypothetical protein